MEQFIASILSNGLFSNEMFTHGVTGVLGGLIPIVIGLILPRKTTIGYGRSINKFLGTIFLQKKADGKVPANLLEKVSNSIQTTFQDVSFGVYIDSRKNLSKEDADKKIAEYLGTEKAAEPSAS